MTTTLITGANKGLGYETAHRLVAAGHTVYVGSRDADRGAKAAAELGAIPLVIDVTDDASVAAAVATVRAAGGLDVLVNNAGIAGPMQPIEAFTAADLLHIFDTNVFGVLRVTSAFLPLLIASAAPVVVNVSSGLGSLTRVLDPSTLESTVPTPGYTSSKAALNMLTVQYAKSYPAVRVNCVDPGYTATDLNGNQGTQTIEEGAEVIVRMALIGADGPTAGFFGRSGPVPW